MLLSILNIFQNQLHVYSIFGENFSICYITNLDQGIGEAEGKVTPAQLSLGEAEICPEVSLDHTQGLAQEVGGAVGESHQGEGYSLAPAE